MKGYGDMPTTGKGKREFYGIAEIAEALGARRQTIAVWLTRGKLPEPDARLKMGPLWKAKTIERWLKENGARLP